MDLHDHAVLDRHARHLGQHLGAEQLGIGRVPGAAGNAREQRLAFGGGEIGGARGRVAVIGRGRARRAEIGPALAMRGEIALPAADILVRQLGEAPHRARELFMLDIDHAVRAIGGDDASLPARGLDGVMRVQIVLRTLGGGEEVDAEPVDSARGRKAGVASAAPIASK